MHPYKGLSLKLPTESFERIPFLDFGGRNANESGKGWSFITTLMNKMEFFFLFAASMGLKSQVLKKSLFKKQFSPFLAS
jgi:hypothetical protein